MLYYLFTIDGDWREYFDINLTEEERAPKKDVLENLIQHEIEVAERNLNGRFMHFIHTSSRARSFFLEQPFLELWQQIIRDSGDVGGHCHEDDPYKSYYYQDNGRMRKVISEQVATFRKAGLDMRCYRGGFLGFSRATVRILEENGILFDFSCEPGRFLMHGEDLISDWRGAPEHQYRMSYDNHCKAGDSGVWEIPVGTSGGKYLYFERSSLEEVKKIALDLKQRSVENKYDIVVSVLTHTYEYGTLEEIKQIERKVSLLKRYGAFINLNELEDILN